MNQVRVRRRSAVVAVRVLSGMVWGVALTLAIAGCGRSGGDDAPTDRPAGASAAASGTAPTAANAARPASGAGGPISVSTVAARARDVDVVFEATGTIASLNSVDIRPQVASRLIKVDIVEGQFVKAGQRLFTLDARNDEVALAKAKAQLARDQASLADAERQLQRSQDLLAQNFISRGAVDTSQTLVDTQRAVIVADRAAIDAAEVGLSYNRIVAPAAGRAGAIDVYAGSTVQPGGSALVTITQLDPIAVSFNLPQRNLDDALRSLAAGGGKVLVSRPSSDEQRSGKLAFVDNAVDSNSGTVKAKAVFANADHTLWPGAFVNVRMVARTLPGAIVVPQAAVIRGPRGSFVYTVGADERAVERPVDVVYPDGTEAVVTGLAAGDRVVVDGRQNVRSGVKVAERRAEGVGRGAASAPGTDRAGSAPGLRASGAVAVAS